MITENDLQRSAKEYARKVRKQEYEKFKEEQKLEREKLKMEKNEQKYVEKKAKQTDLMKTLKLASELD